LLPLLLMSVAGGRYSLFRCQLTGIVNAVGCCPDEASAEAADAASDDQSSSDATMAPAACCTRETVTLRSAPSKVPTTAPHDLGIPPGTLAQVLPPSMAEAAARWLPRVADDRGLPHTPILLVKRSLLI
jgi:hypothetical protein